MDINQQLAEEFKIRKEQVDNTVKLIDDGNTIPFIARYRKEVTGALDDQLLRELDERLSYLRNLEQRKAEVKESIESGGNLTEEIERCRRPKFKKDTFGVLRRKRTYRIKSCRSRKRLGVHKLL